MSLRSRALSVSTLTYFATLEAYCQTVKQSLIIDLLLGFHSSFSFQETFVEKHFVTEAPTHFSGTVDLRFGLGLAIQLSAKAREIVALAVAVTVTVATVDLWWQQF